jgi:endo-1,4-beta-xylanase
VASDFSDLNKSLQLMENFRKNIRQLKEIFGKVYITELDVVMDENDQELIQARAYKLIIRTALEENIECITVFGLTDRDAWKPEKKPLLFDNNLNPKPSYYSALNALLGQ